MRLSIFLDPQEGMSWSHIVEVATRTERGGFHGLYRSDHLTSTAGILDRAATEAWTTIAGLAGRTSRIRLGTLITPLTFHHPSVLSKVVSTIDEMGSGRVDVSIGTGWNTGEHAALGIDFPDRAERFERLEEYLEVLVGLWGSSPFRYHGRYYRVEGILPRPLPARRPPIIVGGHGRRRTPALAARFADEYNIDWPTLDAAHELYGRVDEACVEAGRDPATLGRSALLGLVIGAHPGELRARVAAAAEELGGSDADGWLRSRPGWFSGTPPDVVEWLRGYEAAGMQHAQLRLAPAADLDAIDLLAREVLPAVGSA